jgi:hypothetical protein
VIEGKTKEPNEELKRRRVVWIGCMKSRKDIPTQHAIIINE